MLALASKIQVRRIREWGSATFSYAAALLGIAFALPALPGTLHVAAAAEVTLPQIDPDYTIHVSAQKWSRETRNGYDVFAFRGNCRMTQGPLTATGDEVFLWIDKSGFRGVDESDLPSKTICLLRGNAFIKWTDGRSLSDAQWMGRLFSFHPVTYSGQEEKRFDIPDLDWSRETLKQFQAVQLAQYTQPQPGASGVTTALGTAAPPLLNPATRNQGNRYTQQPGTTQSSAAPPTAQTRVPPQPGAVPWTPGSLAGQQNRYGSTRSGGDLPSSGIAIGQNGNSLGAANSLETLAAPQPLIQAGQQPLQDPEYTAAPRVSQQVGTVLPLGIKSVQFLGRSGGANQTILPSYDAERDETVGQVLGGFRLVVNGVQLAQADGSAIELGTVSLEADNAIVWVRGRVSVGDLSQSTPDRPIELYMEGNIVFQQGNRVIYADRMYYNVSSEYGMILSAEVLTPVPQYQGLVRLKADVIQQRDRQNLIAYGAAVTSSRMGVPRYWLQSDEVELTDTRSDAELAGLTGATRDGPTRLRAKAKNNFVYVGGVPILYWPTFSTDLANGNYYLTGASVGNDSIFGFQASLDWDLFQIIGWDAHPGSKLRLTTGYLTERGPAVGLQYQYDRLVWPFNVPGRGSSDGWFIQDDGVDQIGIDRNGLTPEENTRGRVLSRHRYFWTPNVEGTVETGWISDRNFLEQYFENEWEQEKDFDTAARLRSYQGNQQVEIRGQARVNNFFTETEWLPRIDHTILGQDLIGQRLTYNAHTSVGYGHQRVATTPTDPADAAKFALLPWESDSEGLRVATRQELSLPFALGAWKLNPFVSGEVAHWNEDVNQDDLTRLTGQAGLRAALPMWKVYPNVENRLFDLRGMAHKATFEAEFFYADSSQNMDLLPLYDSLDDNSQEHFRRRMIFNTFGGVLPERFDERNFALRSGMQRWVTAGSTEIVDDMTQLRLGMNQRWQTKRGLPGRERIVDLVALDVDFVYFPDSQRDNFGEDVGVLNYDFRYHIGDRLTLLSDGYVDVFSQGLKMFSAGAQISRPGTGHAYLGLLSIEGPLSANIINGYTEYRMSEKWIMTAGAAFDFGETGSIGQNLALTRIGESALVKVGMNVDHGRDNVSFNFAIEPRFMQSGRLGTPGGQLIGPAGQYGLE